MVKIACVMANYNTPEEYLRRSIESILNQTYREFELIIVDDASTDRSVDVLREYVKKDRRVKVLFNTRNHGLAYSLNKAIKTSNAEYIARMDTDDVARERRFELQIQYMEKNNLDVCGSFAYKFGKINKLSVTPFYHAKYSKYCLLFSTYLMHPTVMIKRQFLLEKELFYNENFRYAQDLELWSRCNRYGKIGIINKVLLEYRTHDGQVSVEKKNEQTKLALSVYKKALQEIGLSASNEQMKLHSVLCGVKRLEYGQESELMKWVALICNKIKKNERKNAKKVFMYSVLCIFLNRDVKGIKKYIDIVKFMKCKVIYVILPISYKFYYSKFGIESLPIGERGV